MHDGWTVESISIVNICPNDSTVNWAEQPIGTMFLYDAGDENNYEIALKTSKNEWLYHAEDDPMVTPAFKEVMRFLKMRNNTKQFGAIDPIEIRIEVNPPRNSFRNLALVNLPTKTRKFNTAKDYEGLGIYGSF